MNSLVNITTEAGVSRRQSRRDHVERLLDLAAHLADEDRVLIEQVYRHGVPIVDIARLSGQQPRRRRHGAPQRLEDMPVAVHFFLLPVQLAMLNRCLAQAGGPREEALMRLVERGAEGVCSAPVRGGSDRKNESAC